MLIIYIEPSCVCLHSNAEINWAIHTSLRPIVIFSLLISFYVLLIISTDIWFHDSLTTLYWYIALCSVYPLMLIIFDPELSACFQSCSEPLISYCVRSKSFRMASSFFWAASTSLAAAFCRPNKSFKKKKSLFHQHHYFPVFFTSESGNKLFTHKKHR